MFFLLNFDRGRSLNTEGGGGGEEEKAGGPEIFFCSSDHKPWAYICSKGFFAGLILGGAYFRRGLSSEGILSFKMGLAFQ